MLLTLLACTPDAPDSDKRETAADTSPIDTAPAESTITNVTWSLHDEIGSIGIVSWEQTVETESVWVEFELDGEWRTSPPRPGVVGTNQALVLGVPYDTTVSFRVAGSSDTYEGVTGPLPEGLVDPTVTTTLPDELDPSVHYLLLGVSTAEEAAWKLIVDRAGRIVWAHPSVSGTGFMQTSVDGTHILWDDDTTVHRMTLDGVVSESVELAGLHHTFVEVADGALVWGGKEGTRDSVWERSADGAIRRVFDCATFWEEHNASLPCDGNTLFWSEADDTLLFSSDNENTVVHLDRATGAVLEYWGQLEGAWAFAAGTVNFWKQHSAFWTAEGHLMLSSWVSAENHVVVAREYVLDADAEQLAEVWACDPASGIVADFSGETRRLDGGNTLLNYGPAATIREYTPECEPAWELVWPTDTSLRRMTVLSDLYALAP